MPKTPRTGSPPRPRKKPTRRQREASLRNLERANAVRQNNLLARRMADLPVGRGEAGQGDAPPPASPAHPLPEPERLAYLRRQWRSGALSLSELAHITGFTPHAIRDIADQAGFGPRATAPRTHRKPQGWKGKPCPGLAECPARGDLLARLFAAIEREIGRFNTLAADDAPAAEIRALAALAATLDKLIGLDRDLITTTKEAADARTIQQPVDPYEPAHARRIRDAIAQALAGLEPQRDGPAG